MIRDKKWFEKFMFILFVDFESFIYMTIFHIFRNNVYYFWLIIMSIHFIVYKEFFNVFF